MVDPSLREKSEKKRGHLNPPHIKGRKRQGAGKVLQTCQRRGKASQKKGLKKKDRFTRGRGRPYSRGERSNARGKTWEGEDLRKGERGSSPSLREEKL